LTLKTDSNTKVDNET